MGLNWYVIHCEALHDRQVERLVGSAGVEVFAPRILKTRQRNGDKPLFPGYVFARFDFLPQHRRIRALPGVSGVVEMPMCQNNRLGTRPRPVSVLGGPPDVPREAGQAGIDQDPAAIGQIDGVEVHEDGRQPAHAGGDGQE